MAGYVVILGTLDTKGAEIDFLRQAVRTKGPPESLPVRYDGRKTMRHTPTITLVRTSAEELAEVGRLVAGQLAESRGPAAVILPLCGFSLFSVAGQPLHDPVADRAFVQGLKAHLPPRVRIIEMDTYLNDPQVGTRAVRLMREMSGRHNG